MPDPIVPPTIQAPLNPSPVAVPQATPPAAPAFPVGGPHKEFAPIEAPVTEYVRPTESVPELPQEVKEAGVETVANHEHPQLTPEHKAVGLEPAKEATPVVITPQPTIQFPYMPAEIPELKNQTKDIKDSKHWLIEFVEYLMKKERGVKN